jgi:[ribosomal protein S5]-alanine N-acetyltransferase
MYITFRRLDKQDLPDLLDLKKESWFGTHTVTLANSYNLETWFEEVSSNTHCPRNLILVAVINDYPRGIFKILNIDWQSRRAEVGWDIYEHSRKQGYGKEMVAEGVNYCFNVINLRRLDAQILVNNEASLKCARAAGFIPEGLQRKAIFKNGKYLDNHLFGLLKEE